MECLEARRYENYVGRKKIKDRIDITLRSLKTYEYIGSKIKNYQIQRGFLLLFIFLSYFFNRAFQEYLEAVSLDLATPSPSYPHISPNG